MYGSRFLNSRLYKNRWLEGWRSPRAHSHQILHPLIPFLSHAFRIWVARAQPKEPFHSSTVAAKVACHRSFHRQNRLMATRNPARKPVEVGSLSHYLQGFYTSQVVSLISSINSRCWWTQLSCTSWITVDMLLSLLESGWELFAPIIHIRSKREILDCVSFISPKQLYKNGQERNVV